MVLRFVRGIQKIYGPIVSRTRADFRAFLLEEEDKILSPSSRIWVNYILHLLICIQK